MTFESVEYPDDETELNAERQLAEYHARATAAEKDLQGYKLAAGARGTDQSWRTVYHLACGNPVFGRPGDPDEIDLAALLQLVAAHRCPEPSEFKKAMARVIAAWQRNFGTPPAKEAP